MDTLPPVNRDDWEKHLDESGTQDAQSFIDSLRQSDQVATQATDWITSLRARAQPPPPAPAMPQGAPAMPRAAPTGAGVEQHRAAVQAAFGDLGPEAVDNMLAIMERESGGNPTAAKSDDVEDSHGVLQINARAHPDLAQKYDLNDPVQNARAAREIYDTQGYGAWYNASKQLGLLNGQNARPSGVGRQAYSYAAADLPPEPMGPPSSEGDRPPSEFEPTPAPQDLRPSQFGDPELTTQEAYSACGPAAAVAFARANGRNPSLREALDIAKDHGWTAEGGMNGIANEAATLDAMGIPYKLDTRATWGKIQQDAMNGNPVIVSTPGHYFVADAYDPKTGKYHVGSSGTDTKGGAEWMSPDEIQARMGAVNGALFVDSPTSPVSSIAAKNVDPEQAALSWIDSLKVAGGQAVDSAKSALGLGGAASTGSGVGRDWGGGSGVGGSFADDPMERERVRAGLPPRAEPVPDYPIPDAIAKGVDAVRQVVSGAQALDEQTFGPLADRQLDEQAAQVAQRTGIPQDEAKRQIQQAYDAAMSFTGEPLHVVRGAARAVRGIAPLAEHLGQPGLSLEVTGDPARRVYHGTGSAFDRPDPGKFDEAGLFGPGYYLTSDPRVASSYAEARADRATSAGAGPNVRAVDVPAGLNLYNLDDPPAPADLRRMADALSARYGARRGESFLEDMDLALRSRTPPSGQDVTDMLAHYTDSDVGDTQAAFNSFMAEAGFDGYYHRGGKRVPLMDDGGRPIEHDVTVVFPESLGKIRNAISGTEGGQIDAGYAVRLGGAVAGGAGGYATAEPQQPGESDRDYALRVGGRTLSGAVLGGVGVTAATAEGRAALRDLGVRARRAGLVPGLSLEVTGGGPSEADLGFGRQPPTTDAAADLKAGLDDLERAKVPVPRKLAEEAAVAPPASAGFQQFWNRARNVIASQGEAGQQLAKKLTDWRNTAETMAGDWTSRLKPVRDLTSAEFRNFVDVAEGKAEPTSSTVKRAADAWAAVRSEVYDRAKAAGLDIGKQEDYFPHVFPDGTFSGKGWSQAIDHLVQSGQAASREEAAQTLRYAQDVRRNRRYGNLEAARDLDLPFYKKTPDVLFNSGGYLDAAANRIAQVETFGQKDADALALIDRIGRSGGDAGAAKALYDISVGATKYGSEQQTWSGRLRGFNTVTSLGLSAITNAGQSVNTATVAGFGPTLKAAWATLRDPAAREYAVKAGVTLDNVVQQVREGTGVAAEAGKWVGRATAPGFGVVEKFNRTLALHAGIDYAQSMAAKAATGDAGALRALDRLGLDARAVAERGTLTEAEKTAAGRNMVERTQFRVDPQDLPGWASSPVGKVFAQFKTFSYNQSAFLAREIIGPAVKEHDLRPLARFMLAGLVAGAATTEAKNALQGREPEQDWTKRVLQYYQAAGGLGLAGDVLRVTSPVLNINADRLDPDRVVTQAVGTVMGPTVGTGIEALSGVAQMTRGNPTPLLRSAARRIPVVGTTIQNLAFPYKGPTASSTAPVGRSSAKPPAPPKPPSPPRPGRSTR